MTAFAPTVITADPATRDAGPGRAPAGPPAAGPAPSRSASTSRARCSPRLAAARIREHLAARTPTARPRGRVVARRRGPDGHHRPRAARRPRGRRAPRRLAGVVVSIGHTEATADQAAAAVAAGATGVTHLGNAMPPMLSPRARARSAWPWAGPDLVAGVIADGHHLHPATPAGRSGGHSARAVPRGLRHHRGPGDGPTAAPGWATRTWWSPTARSGSPTARWPDRPPHCSRAAVLLDDHRCSVAEAVATATTTPARLIGDAAAAARTEAGAVT